MGMYPCKERNKQWKNPDSTVSFPAQTIPNLTVNNGDIVVIGVRTTIVSINNAMMEQGIYKFWAQRGTTYTLPAYSTGATRSLTINSSGQIEITTSTGSATPQFTSDGYVIPVNITIL